MRMILIAGALALAGCDQGTPGYAELSRYVANNRVGSDADQWVEMLNFGGEWERVALVFGYVDDPSECGKVIAGLKAVNYAREYRCTPAN